MGTDTLGGGLRERVIRWPRLCLVSAVLWALALAPVRAATWDGGGTNNNWSTGANWTDDSVPANNGSVNMGFNGSTRLTPNMDTNWNIKGITFLDGAGAFTISGSQLTMGSDGIVHDDDDTQTINNAIVMTADQT